jgi:hypothetical protein
MGASAALLRIVAGKLFRITASLKSSAPAVWVKYIAPRTAGLAARLQSIKVLPEMSSGDPERMARFELEARLLATLTHLNIAAIYGLEESDANLDWPFASNIGIIIPIL